MALPAQGEILKKLPYGRQTIDDSDVAALIETLLSDWLTTGPKVPEFERALAAVTGSEHAVAVSSGTAALHAIANALGIVPGDEVIVPAITFAATANAVVFEGGTPRFADVDPKTLLIDPESVRSLAGPRTKAIFAVDYAGQPCDYGALEEIATASGLVLVDDACHSLGAALDGRPAGSLALASAFSFHPVKAITTGEGGAVTTGDEQLAERMRRFRSHGISADHHARAATGSWRYEMTSLGYNYRLSDLGCALGLSQLSRLQQFVARRRELAARYDAALARIDGIEPLHTRPGVEHAYHLYAVRIDADRFGHDRAEVFQHLRERDIQANVHYLPVHLHPFYRERFGSAPGDCPAAEAAYSELLSLPLFPGMEVADVDRVVQALTELGDA